MNMTRVDRDGVEFFTLNLTGESGMSESGLAKLCGVSQQAVGQLLNILVTTSDPPKCLKHLLGKDFELQLRGAKNAKVLKAPVCAAIIEYYAFESRRKTKEALFAYRKFASMGVTAWIQSITGWQNLPSYSPRSQLSTRQSVLIPAKPDQSATLDFEMIDYLLDRRLSSTVHRLYLYLLKTDAMGRRPNVNAICKESKVSRPSFYRSIRVLQNLNLVPDWLIVETYQCIEKGIRDRLQQQLGGQTEVNTPFGPIDLLTPGELIEIKAIENWKEAIGHVLAKSRFYPSHQKRLHLFGSSAQRLQDIEACCAEFQISITFEFAIADKNGVPS